MPRILRRLSCALLIAALLGGAGLWAVGNVLTRSTNSKVTAPAFPARGVRIASTDGIELAGSYWPGSAADAPAILMLHGNGSNRGAMSEGGSWLNEQGYAVLAIDLRGHGESSPAEKSFGLHEADDARAALAWLRQRNPGGRVGAIGFSLGGAAILIGPQGPLPVDALVLEGVYPDIRRAIFNRLAIRMGKWPATVAEPLLSYQSLPRFGVWPSSISPLAALSRVREPVMIVGGGADTNTPPAETRAMYDAVKTHGQLHILAGIGHNKLGSAMPDDLKRSLLAFLDENLKSRTRGSI